MNNTSDNVKTIFEKWAKNSSIIPKDLVKNLHIENVEEHDNYFFSHHATSIYTIERESVNPGNEFEFEEGEDNPKYLDYLKPDNQNWIKEVEKIPFKRYRSSTLIIPSTINTFNCDKTQICPKCDGHKKYDCDLCRGTGRIDCNRCRGTGACKICDGEKRLKCRNCSGTGKVTDVSIGAALSSDKRRKTFKKKRCTECRAGWNKCCECSGQGKCTECRGKGELKCEAYGCNRGIIDCEVCQRKGTITCKICKGIGTAQEFHTYQQDYAKDVYKSSVLNVIAESKESHDLMQNLVVENYESINYKNEFDEIVIDKININENKILEQDFSSIPDINSHLANEIKSNIEKIISIPYYNLIDEQFQNPESISDIDSCKEDVNREICDYKINCVSFKTLTVNFEYKGGNQTCSIIDTDGENPLIYYEGKLRAPELVQYKFSKLRYIIGPIKGWFYNSKKLKLYTLVVSKMIWADGKFDPSEKQMFDKFIEKAKTNQKLKVECKQFILSEPSYAEIKKAANKVYQADKLNALVFAWHTVISDNDTDEKELDTFNKISELFDINEEKKVEIKKRAESNFKLYEFRTFLHHGKLYWKKINPILFLLKLSFFILFWIFFVLSAAGNYIVHEAVERDLLDPSFECLFPGGINDQMARCRDKSELHTNITVNVDKILKKTNITDSVVKIEDIKIKTINKNIELSFSV